MGPTNGKPARELKRLVPAAARALALFVAEWAGLAVSAKSEPKATVAAKVVPAAIGIFLMAGS